MKRIESAVLRRLGPVPFWRGEERCLEALDAIYRRAAAAARRRLNPDATRRPSAKAGAGRAPRS